MDKIEMLERLVSIKNNALERSRQEAKGNPFQQLEIKAFILQNGIEQLVMEIQNSMLAYYGAARAVPACQLSVTPDADEDASNSWPGLVRRIV